MLEVVGEELALGVVTGEAHRGLGQVVRAERAEVRHLGDLVGADARARQLDHRAAEVLDRGLLGRDPLGQLAEPRSSSRKPTSGCMISTSGGAPVRSPTAAAARTIARTCIS